VTPAGGRRRACTRAEARALVTYATAYLDTARRVRDEGAPGSDHVAIGNAVLAAVAAADAICGTLLGERSRGADHREAVALLRSVRDGGPLATALDTALGSKDAAHYGIAGIGRDAQVRALRAAEALVAAARDVVAAP
jgi:hypothetical protein